MQLVNTPHYITTDISTLCRWCVLWLQRPCSLSGPHEAGTYSLLYDVVHTGESASLEKMCVGQKYGTIWHLKSTAYAIAYDYYVVISSSWFFSGWNWCGRYHIGLNCLVVSTCFTHFWKFQLQRRDDPNWHAHEWWFTNWKWWFNILKMFIYIYTLTLKNIKYDINYY